MTDEKAVSSAQISTALLHLIVHNNEIYGNIVGYLRVNGIVPPSTAARATKREEEVAGRELRCHGSNALRCPCPRQATLGFR